MTDLTGRLISNTYKQLILVSSAVSNEGVDTSLKPIQTGDGTNTALKVATNAVQVSGALGVTGSVSFDSNLHVDNRVCASAFYGDGSNITGVTAVIAGNISVSNAVVGGTLQVSSTATIVGATHLKSTVTVGGAANFGSTVTVEGKAVFKDDVSVSGAANFGSTVTVEGEAIFNNNVSVSGTFNVAGASTFTSKATFDNDVSVSGRLDVATSASVGGTFRATGNAGFSGDTSVSGDLNVGGTVTIAGTNIQATNARVCASAFYGDGSNLTNVEAQLGVTTNISVSGFINAGGAVSVSGTFNAVGSSTFKDDVSVSGNLRIGGTTTIAGAVSLASTLSVAGATNFASTVTIAGATSLGSTLDVTGNTSIGGTFLATGKAEFKDDVSVSGNVNIGGTTTIAGAVSLASTLSVGGAANFGDTVTVAGAVSLASTLSVGGATHLASTVTVAGAAIFEDSVSVSGNIDVAGNVSVGGTLFTTGNTTFDGNVSVSGNVNIGGTTTIGGAVSLASTLSVGGASNFGSTVTIAGATSLGSTLNVNSNTSIGGTLINTGKAEFEDDVSVSGALIVGGATQLNSTVTVAGAATFEGAVSVSGAVNIAGNTSVGGTFLATGKAEFEGDVSVSGNVNIGNDLTLISDDAVLGFGADTDITITHDPDDGLFFKSAATADDNPFVLTLQTGETDIAADDKLGVINFQAPDEAAGTDAILVAAGIEAVSEGDFSASSNATSLAFKTGSSAAADEKVRIDSSGRVQIGTTSATNNALLTIRDSGSANPMARISFDSGDSDVSNGVKVGYTAASFAPDFEISNGDAGIIRFSTSDTERVRIMSGGNVGIGTTAPDVPLHVKGGSSTESAIIVDSTGVGGGHKYGIRPGSPSVSNAHFTIHDETNDATRFVITDGGLVLINTTAAVSGQQLRVHGNNGTGTIAIAAATNFNSTLAFGDPANSAIGKIEYAHNGDQLRFFVNGSQRGLIDSSGRLLMLKTAAGLANNGFETHASAAGFLGTTSTGAALYVNREDSDGTLVVFRQDNSDEGSISVSGSTVSYNGGHLSRWSQTADGNRIDGLLKGTVMTNLDKMAVWTKEDGTVKNNEQLNCMAVSSVEGDVNVSGVFVNWNEEELYDDAYSSSRVNDMNIAMTGDMVIRIASGTTIARGDLLMSAGDGTAKPQGDDIVRSKTIAKVISTNVSHTYSDGSYLVPCVLMAC